MQLQSTPEESGLILYSFYITGPQGAKFELFPERNEHTHDDVENAKKWLRANHDVVKIEVEWVEPESEKEKELYDQLDKQWSDL